jgi:triple functional domain protein
MFFFCQHQVLDWLGNHGEAFICKNTGIGRSLQKARVYQKSHEHFERVAQVGQFIE